MGKDFRQTHEAEKIWLSMPTPPHLQTLGEGEGSPEAGE